MHKPKKICNDDETGTPDSDQKDFDLGSRTHLSFKILITQDIFLGLAIDFETRDQTIRMSDVEADPSLLDLLRQSLGLNLNSEPSVPETRVLESAEYVYDNAIDVAIDSANTKAAAKAIYAMMQLKSYSTTAWSEHELHPKIKDETTVNFIFTMDLLNFSFWSERSEADRFAVEFRGKRWTGYWSLVASLQRALEEGMLAGFCNRRHC